MNGGAPNNFKLVVNPRLSAPFGSTVSRGWLTEARGKVNFTVESERENIVSSGEITEMRKKYESKNRGCLLERAVRGEK